MGVAALAAIAGIAAIAGGSFMEGKDKDKNKKALREAEDMWLPETPGGYASDYFSEMIGFNRSATKLADEITDADFDRVMRMREKALPGIGKATASHMDAIAPLLKGELPPEVLAAFKRAGGASTVGGGFGGSPFGFLNTGLFGARGSLGAMQQGSTLLTSLIGTLPNVNPTSSLAFLQAIMTPAQRTTAALQFRQQQLGMRQAWAGMQGSGGVYGDSLQQVGGILLGGAMGGGGGAMMGGMQTGPSGMGAGNMGSSNMGFLAGHERISGY